MPISPEQEKLKRFIEDSQAMRDDPDYPLFQAGIQEGIRQTRKLALDALEAYYMGLPRTDTPEAKAALEITRSLSRYLLEHAKDGETK